MEMLSPLQLNDILDFEDLFKGIMQDILNKHAREVSFSEELVSGFHKLYLTIDQLLARAGRKLLISAN
jgi:hypothetical protein